MKRLTGACCLLLLVSTPAIAKPDAAQTLKSAPSPQRAPQSALRYFNGNECDSRKGGCQPDVVILGRHAEHRLSLRQFDEAVSGGSTGAYFTSDQWRYLVPSLQYHPRLLEILKSGIPIVRLDRPNGRRFYVATRLTRQELLRRIAARPKSKVIEGVEVCIPIQVK